MPTSVPRVLIAPDPRDPLSSRVPRRPGSTAKSHLNQLSELSSGSRSLQSSKIPMIVEIEPMMILRDS
ncbi:hypothetical protein ATN37_28415 [Rhodococcus sp. MH15]|nr:hypothetical protein [Rhodococcus sp. MH15]